MADEEGNMNNNGSTPLFLGFYKRFIDQFEKRLHIVMDKHKTKVSLASLNTILLKEIGKLGLQMLVFELNYSREKNILVGSTSEERYKFFCNMIKSDQFYQYIKTEYPVFNYLVNKKIDHIIQCVDNILTSFEMDQNELEKTFDKKFLSIDKIDMECGDAHSCGKTIAILNGNFGKIVYKSHNLTNDLVLNEIIEFLDLYGKLEYKLKRTKVLSKEDHGWQEFIENRECVCEDEVKRFYYRLGVYLAIFFILNSGDMHYENIISEGEYPRIIDTETLVTISKYNTFLTNQSTHNFPMDNVLSTSLLPVNNENSILDVDMSGLTGGDFKSKKIREYYIENYGTDRMKIVRKNLVYKMQQTNIPKIKGKNVDVTIWEKEFVKGFDSAMHIFKENKSILTGYLSRASIQNSNQRQLFRNTYVYAKYLEASYSPKYLGSFKARNELFSILIEGNKKDYQRIKQEIKILNEGFIPAFHTKFDTTDLFSDSELIQKHYFNQSGKSTIAYKINTLSDETICLQKHIISLSFMTLIKDLIKKPEVDGFISEEYETCLSGVASILGNIHKNTLIDPENGNKDLYIVRLGKEGHFIQGIDLSLYEGGGLIWAMYCYSRETDNEELKKCCFDWIKTAEERQRQYSVNNSLSIFGGIGSLIYIFFNLYRDTQSDEMLTLYLKYLIEIGNRIESIESIDYMHGLSGYLVMLSKMAKLENRIEIQNVLKKIITLFDYRISNYKVGEAGIAHGGSGIAIATSIRYKMTKDRRYMQICLGLLEQESKYIDLENKFWCRGLTGRVLAKAAILLNCKDADLIPEYTIIKKKFQKEMEDLLQLDTNMIDNLCMCHGVYGYYDCLVEMANKYSCLLENKIVGELEQKINHIKKNLPAITPKRLWLSSSVNLETFMLGSSGIAYSLLRLLNNSYPSVLMLETF